MGLNLKAKINSKCGNGTLSIMDGQDLCPSAATFLSEVANRIPKTYHELQEVWKKASQIKRRRQIQEKKNCQEIVLEQSTEVSCMFRNPTTLLCLYNKQGDPRLGYESMLRACWCSSLGAWETNSSNCLHGLKAGGSSWGMELAQEKPSPQYAYWSSHPFRDL